MRLGGERRIVDDADQRVAHARGVERLQDRHGVAAPAAAGIVGDIGEGKRGAASVGSRLRQARPPPPGWSGSGGIGRAGPSRRRRFRAPGVSAACWSVAVTTTVRPLNGVSA